MLPAAPVMKEKPPVSFHLIRLSAGAPVAECVNGALRWPAGAVPGAVIGNFDGMHLGHLSLIRLLDDKLSEIPAGSRAAPILLSFVPHPRRMLAGVSRNEARRLATGGDSTHLEITPFRSKCTIAADLGLNYGCFLTFNQALKNLSAVQFVEQVLAGMLGLKAVVVGYDWIFGRGRSGTVEELKRIGAGCGLDVIIAPKFEQADGAGLARVSSSLVRTALAAGDLARIERLTGRCFSLSGRIVRGDQRGEKIGFPTANLHLPSQLLPPDGVYAAWARLSGPGQEPQQAVVNIGVRPTFDGINRKLEVHLPGFSGGPLYHRRLDLEFAGRIRSEMKFVSVEELTNQIKQDIQIARLILGAARAAGSC